MIIVSDTSPISNLLAIGKLDLLNKVFQHVLIPPKVYEEVVALRMFEIDISFFEEAQWIKRTHVDNNDLYKSLVLVLDQGEAEAITLAKKLNPDYLLMDEMKGRKVAEDLSIRTIGLLGVLLKAKEQTYIPSVKPVMDDLIHQGGFWISQKVYQNTLDLAGEL